jgi:GntR family transcriptional repressor for pyruvate dehydrogenase complex
VTSLTDSAIEQIKQMIISGSLRPGDRLPREQDLADLLGVARGTLREAVRALSIMKVLDVRQGDGTFVTSLAPELMLEALNFVVDLHRDDTVLHFLEVRSFLEPECTARAALAISAEAMRDLSVLLDEADDLYRAEPIDHEALIVNDQRFHAVVNAAGQNPVAAAILAATAGVTRGVRIARSMDSSGQVNTVGDHRSIYAAVNAGDPARARLHAAMHVARTEDWVRELLGEDRHDSHRVG